MGRRNRTAHGAYNFWPAYTDVTLGVVFVLVLYLIGQLIVNSELLNRADTSIAAVRARQDTIRRAVVGARGVVKVEEDGTLQTITLNADVLFPTDSAELKPDGAATVVALGKILHLNERYFTRLAVEGHADQLPSRVFQRRTDLTEEGGNWRLSAERAIRVVQQLQHSGIEGGKLEATARSWYAPADTAYRSIPGWSRRTAEPAVDTSLRKNRRIIIRIVYSVRSGERPRSAHGTRHRDPLVQAR